MFPKRLVVYEATYAKTATSQKGTLPSVRGCRCSAKYVYLDKSQINVSQNLKEDSHVTSLVLDKRLFT